MRGNSIPIKACSVCGKVFDIIPSQHKSRKYCSRICKSVAQQNRVGFSCANCNKDVWRTPAQLKSKKTDQIFCSFKCLGQYNANQASEKREKRICPICKEGYSVKPSDAHKFAVCSRKCRAIYDQDRIICKCAVCGVNIVKTPSQLKKSASGNVFCSNVCVGKYNAIKRKRRILKTCVICQEIYNVIPSQEDTSKTCSRKCQGIWQSTYRTGENSGNFRGGPITRECSNCGNTYKGKRYAVNQGVSKFCSKQCKQIYWTRYILHNTEFKKAHFLGNLKARQAYPRETKPEKMVREWLEAEGFIKNKHFKQEQGFFRKYFADFWFINSKIIIEVMGDFWHANPNVYGEGEGLIPLSKQQEIQIAKDREKSYDFVKHGFRVIKLWETDIKNHLEQMMEKILIEYKLNQWL